MPEKGAVFLSGIGVLTAATAGTTRDMVRAFAAD